MNMKRPDGGSLFRVLDTGLVCDDCLKARKASECTHKRGKVANWKSTRRMDIFKHVMKGDPEKYAREVLGAGVSGDTQAFESESVDVAIDASAFKFESDVDMIWLAIDPSGGGSASDYAICSITHTGMRPDKKVQSVPTDPHSVQFWSNSFRELVTTQNHNKLFICFHLLSAGSHQAMLRRLENPDAHNLQISMQPWVDRFGSREMVANVNANWSEE